MADIFLELKIIDLFNFILQKDVCHGTHVTVVKKCTSAKRLPPSKTGLTPRLLSHCDVPEAVHAAVPLQLHL